MFHGWAYPDSSPFQSTISQLWMLHGPSLSHHIKQISRSALRYCQQWMGWFTDAMDSSVNQMAAANASAASNIRADSFNVRRLDVPSSAATSDAFLEPHDAEAFHATLQVTHDDDVIDQAIAAYFPLVTERISWLRPPVLRQRQPSYCDNDIAFLTAYEIESLAYMLSDETSIRANVTAAAFIVDPLTHMPFPGQYVHIDSLCL